MTIVKLALDWTPNTNHIGFYVALVKGWYVEKGIDLLILPPSSSCVKTETPGRMLVTGEADLCIAPSESLISMWLSGPDRPRPIAIATILAHDTTAIVAKKSSGVERLKDLDWKRYASYEGRYEMAIIRQMIKNDGGQGIVGEITQSSTKLDCFDAVLRGEADATWIFMCWEGIMALREHCDLNYFPISDWSVPYGYSPLLIAHPHFLLDDITAKAFLEVTSRGYEYATSNMEEAVDLFMSAAHHPSLDALGKQIIRESMTCLSIGNHFIDPSMNKWGVMSKDKWERFIHWLLQNNLLLNHDGQLATEVDMVMDVMFTNDYLPYT